MVGTADLLAQLARCRGLTAADEAGAAHFEAALRHHDGHDRPFELARTELAYGEALRRARRRAEARSHLRGALATFQRIGAEPWVERAASELRATGETARRRDPSTLTQLTLRSSRSSGWSGRAGPTARSAPSCSSAAGPSTTTCGTCS